MKKNNKTKFYKKTLTALLLVITFAFSILSGCSMGCGTNSAFSEVLSLINEYSVVVEETSYDELISKGVDGVLSQDKYAKYYSKEEYDKEKQEDKGNFSGFGFTFKGGTNEVYSVVYNSPAERAGITGGDVIKSICYKNFVYEIEDFEDISKAVGAIGTGEQAVFNVEREIEDVQERDITLTKEEYKAGYVLYQDNQKELRIRTNEKGEYYFKEFLENKNTVLLDNVAYIKFTEFSGDSASQLEQALNYAKANDKNKLILDLRSNGGGRLDVLQEVCALLLPTTAKKGDLLVNARLKTDDQDFCLEKQGKNDYILDTVVLANAGTASASEALIGALNYYGAGGFSLDKLVCEYNGNRDNFSTYGKGIMQTTFNLSTGGALKLTTAKIYQPDGETCIHDTGISPTDSLNQITGVIEKTAVLRAIQILKG